MDNTTLESAQTRVATVCTAIWQVLAPGQEVRWRTRYTDWRRIQPVVRSRSLGWQNGSGFHLQVEYQRGSRPRALTLRLIRGKQQSTRGGEVLTLQYCPSSDRWTVTFLSIAWFNDCLEHPSMEQMRRIWKELRIAASIKTQQDATKNNTTAAYCRTALRELGDESARQIHAARA